MNQSENYEELGNITQTKKENHSYCCKGKGPPPSPRMNMDSPRDIFNEQFYIDVYDYYYRKGFWSIILSEISDIILIICGTLFFTFMCVLLDWNQILKCGSDNLIQDCGELRIYVKPIVPNFFFLSVIFFGIVSCVYKIVNFVFYFKTLSNIKHYYEKELYISSRDIETMQWSFVIQRISETNGKKITIHDITNIILKEENYLLSLFQRNILGVPSYMYTKQFDVNLRNILFRSSYSSIHIMSEKSLKIRFILYGFMNLILSIFIFISLLVHFFVANIDDYNSTKKNITNRRYTIYAKTLFRHYNELPHFFDERLNKSYRYANEYLKQFPQNSIEVLSKFISLLAGGFIGFFVIVSILDESILLYVKLFNRSLLFYAGIFGAISATSRSMIREPEENVFNPENILTKVIKYTHHKPKPWEGRLNSYYVRDEFMALFDNRIKIFFFDLKKYV